MGYKIDELLKKPVEWINLIGQEVIRQRNIKLDNELAMHGIDPAKARKKTAGDDKKIITNDKLLNKIGIGRTKRGK